MMESWYWWMLLGMAVVTYLPRAIPLTFLEGKELSPAISGVLRNIPYAVLGALIFPAILYAQPDDLVFGVIGLASAALIAWWGGGVMGTVLGTIALLAVYSLITG